MDFAWQYGAVNFEPVRLESMQFPSKVVPMVVVGVLRQYPLTKTIRLSEWVAPGDTAIPGMTSLKDGDLQHSSALAQSPKEI